MTIVTALEAQALLPRLLADVARGEEVVITDGGSPVARLVQAGLQETSSTSPSQRDAAEVDREEQEADEVRPWRGVFAIESPGEPYPDVKLHLPSLPQASEQQPADILWDRMNFIDE